jgi:hypothetical protein
VSRKGNTGNSWFDEHYLWQYTELTAFISSIASLCGNPLNRNLQSQIDNLQYIIRESLKSEDFMWSAISNTPDDLRNGYDAIVSLAESDGFSTPMPERISYGNYWNKIQVIVLSEYVKSLKSMKRKF